MKSLVLMLFVTLCMFSNSHAQGYECTDINGKPFSVVITSDAYNIAVDSFLFITKVDTVVMRGDTTIYCPKESENHDSLFVCGKKTIVLRGVISNMYYPVRKEYSSEELDVIFNRKYYYWEGPMPSINSK